MKQLLLILLCIASPVQAEIYRWTDSRGTAHFTNSIYEIPERYRARAKTVNLGIPEPKSDQSQVSQPAPAPLPSQPASAALPSPPQPPPVEAAPKADVSRPTPIVRTNKSFRKQRRSGAEE